jgi:hypothetical protein
MALNINITKSSPKGKLSNKEILKKMELKILMENGRAWLLIQMKWVCLAKVMAVVWLG